MAKNYFGISDKGRVRDNNEDTFVIEKILDDRYILACVIDGVGGYTGGEVAAAIARDQIIAHFKEAIGDIFVRMREALIAVNDKIQSEKRHNKDNERMACVLTLAIVDVFNNKFYYAHVGDTRLYLLRDHSLVKITKDHSFVGFLEDNGKLSEAQAMKHPKRNEINKALGFDGQIAANAEYIETGESPFLPGDMILLCSDGLTDMVNNSEMTAVLTNDKTLEEKGKELVDLANTKGGKDNITIALVQHDTARKEQVATKPATALKKNDTPEVEFAKATKSNSMVNLNASAKKRSYKGLITFFVILCIALLGTIGWLLFKQSKNGEAATETSKLPVPISDSGTLQQSPEEIKFRDSLSGMTSSVLIFDSTYGKSLMLTAPITIDKDTLILRGRGNPTITKHTDYTGPGIILSSNCKYVLLDSITLENFEIGIIAMNNALRLNNVLFKNVRVGVQSQYTYPNNTYITGRIRDTVTARTDTTKSVH
jgi:serine/threonine protein phosphatase PrpC